jgi:chromosome segregation ATPase
MSSKFMGKRVNMFLLIMIILVLIGMGGVSVYYQYTFKQLNDKFDKISTDLGSCEQNLSQTANTLITTIRNLNSTETDIRKYDVLYEQKAGELKDTKEELSDTQAELTRTALQKEVYKKQIDDAYSKIIGLNSTIKSLNKQVDDLTDDIEEKLNIISCLKNTDDDGESACI